MRPRSGHVWRAVSLLSRCPNPCHRVALVIARLAEPMEIPLCFMIRSEVFIEGQGVPASVVLDGRDACCAQFIALVDGEPAGSARLRFTDAGEAKAERVAVLVRYRGRQLGVSLMRAMEGEALARGYRAITLHAQDSAVGFYQRLGYAAEGEPFTEADIVHFKMHKAV